MLLLGEPKLGVKTIKTYTNHMKSENVCRAILVTQQNMTPMARTCISEISSKFHMEVFSFQWQTKPIGILIVSCIYFGVNGVQLPRIQLTDPVAKYYGLKRGQVMKIIRPSETAGRYITYRYVV
ncbi:DNA-directed RNA polymerases II and IV subunit 5A-like [Prunus yedoensis var. nudiflora]|uniref:DNA-directed RNA polymerases II and IV subunit 5A-like n=1 Tax=Prunus yedoensis var. nudiflora TaxID=2094558 RepID=A0A314ZD29_PRUYE|nr:DNA-directed RNA polymerases II and IV subunit 5A-like [Prunus yedoensis var. nudiflora]